MYWNAAFSYPKVDFFATQTLRGNFMNRAIKTQSPQTSLISTYHFETWMDAVKAHKLSQANHKTILFDVF